MTTVNNPIKVVSACKVCCCLLLFICTYAIGVLVWCISRTKSVLQILIKLDYVGNLVKMHQKRDSDQLRCMVQKLLILQLDFFRTLHADT